jgi:hypothetical protein
MKLAPIALFAACGGGAQDGSTPPAPPPIVVERPAPSEPAPRPSAVTPHIVAPEGWRRERSDATLIVSSPSSPAVIALTTLPLSATMARIEEEAHALTKSVALTLPSRIRLTALAEQSEMAGARKLALWEHLDAERGGRVGAVVIFAGKLDDEALVVGIGFAPTDDELGTEAILGALKTIAPVAAASP